MNDPLQWHRDERDSLVRQIQALASGQIRARRLVDGTIEDSTEDAIRDLRIRLLKLDRFLGEPPPRPRVKG
jgi:hypothetical protein